LSPENNFTVFLHAFTWPVNSLFVTRLYKSHFYFLSFVRMVVHITGA
jgi:hypothetical protein